MTIGKSADSIWVTVKRATVVVGPRVGRWAIARPMYLDNRYCALIAFGPLTFLWRHS